MLQRNALLKTKCSATVHVHYILQWLHLLCALSTPLCWHIEHWRFQPGEIIALSYRQHVIPISHFCHEARTAVFFKHYRGGTAACPHYISHKRACLMHRKLYEKLLKNDVCTSIKQCKRLWWFHWLILVRDVGRADLCLRPSGIY